MRNKSHPVGPRRLTAIVRQEKYFVCQSAFPCDLVHQCISFERQFHIKECLRYTIGRVFWASFSMFRWAKRSWYPFSRSVLAIQHSSNARHSEDQIFLTLLVKVLIEFRISLKETKLWRWVYWSIHVCFLKKKRFNTIFKHAVVASCCRIRQTLLLDLRWIRISVSCNGPKMAMNLSAAVLSERASLINMSIGWVREGKKFPWVFLSRKYQRLWNLKIRSLLTEKEGCTKLAHHTWARTDNNIRGTIRNVL